MTWLLRMLSGIGREINPDPIDLEALAKREKEQQARLQRVRMQRKVIRRGKG